MTQGFSVTIPML